MSLKDVIRAWKDRNYRENLSEEELAQVLANPVGDVLSEEELQAAIGGMKSPCVTDVEGGDICSCIETAICRVTEQCALLQG